MNLYKTPREFLNQGHVIFWGSLNFDDFSEGFFLFTNDNSLLIYLTEISSGGNKANDEI